MTAPASDVPDRATLAARELAEYLAAVRAPHLATVPVMRAACRTALRDLLTASHQLSVWSREGTEARFEASDPLVKARLEDCLRQHVALGAAIDAAVTALRTVADCLTSHENAVTELERTVADPQGAVVTLGPSGRPVLPRDLSAPQLAAAAGMSFDELLERVVAELPPGSFDLRVRPAVLLAEPPAE